MNIKITADSTCDLPAELLKKHNITLAPLHVIMAGSSLSDGVNVTPNDIFAHVAAGGELCSTAAVSIGEYLDLFCPLSQEYDAVVHISLGSGFSSSYRNACLAAGELSNVHVIDSCNLSMGQGQVVMEACRMAEDCTDVEAMCQSLRELTGRIESCFLLDKLDYLAKGGRCSSLVALGANLLRLKPCIEVVDGEMRVGKKYRGTYIKCLGEYVQDRLAGRGDIDRTRLLAPFTAQPGENLAAFRKAVAHSGKFKTVVHAPAGCTISCHCGPCTVGLMFIRRA